MGCLSASERPAPSLEQSGWKGLVGGFLSTDSLLLRWGGRSLVGVSGPTSPPLLGF